MREHPANRRGDRQRRVAQESEMGRTAKGTEGEIGLDWLGGGGFVAAMRAVRMMAAGIVVMVGGRAGGFMPKT